MVWRRRNPKKSNRRIRLVHSRDPKPKKPSTTRKGLGRLRMHMDNFTSSKWVYIVIFCLIAFSIFASNRTFNFPVSYNTKYIKVISGDTIKYKNRMLKFSGVTCPSVDTEEGLEAKRLVSSYLFSTGVEYSKVSCKSTFWKGSNTIKCKRSTARASLSEFLINSGLCKGE